MRYVKSVIYFVLGIVSLLFGLYLRNLKIVPSTGSQDADNLLYLTACRITTCFQLLFYFVAIMFILFSILKLIENIIELSK